jgi:hypothetical protein
VTSQKDNATWLLLRAVRFKLARCTVLSNPKNDSKIERPRDLSLYLTSYATHSVVVALLIGIGDHGQSLLYWHIYTGECCVSLSKFPRHRIIPVHHTIYSKTARFPTQDPDPVQHTWVPPLSTLASATAKAEIVVPVATAAGTAWTPHSCC